MNYGRGFPLPQYGNGNRSRNREPWIPEMGIPAENGIGQISMFGQQFQQRGEMERLGETLRRPIMVDDGMIRGKELESESWKTSIVRTSQMRNGIVGSNNNRDSYTTIHQGNGIVRNGNGNGNGENWNPVIPTNLYSQGNCSNSWTPVTPGKSNPCNKPVNQVESENWGNLLGMYGDLLRPDTLNLNEVAQDRYPMVQNNGNQNRVLSTTNRNLNPILNSSHIPIPKPTHDLNQVLPSVSYFPSEDRANWDSGLLAAIVRPKKSSTSVPFFNESQNNSFHDLNQKPVSDSSTQVESNSVRPTHVGSMLGNQNSNQLPSDGFSVPYRPCYNLNSPPRSELDAASSGITGQLPFTPITPDTRQKSTENQWVPVKNGQESQRNEDADNVYNDLFTSSAVSTTQKEGLVSEEGEELGIDLNKTPNQKTPARRKKHRPKVIREGKVKKSATPKDVKNTGLNETPVKRKYVRKSPKENGVEISPEGIKGRRKYVRKKGVESVDQSVSQQKTQVEEATEPILETPVKSCKKQLNFDLECGARDESRTRVDQSGFNLNDNPQDIEQERRINLERSSMRVAQNNMYAGVTTHQESPRINGPATPMANARDHALNVLARNLLMRNAVSGQGVWRNVSNHVGPVSTNGHSQTVNYDERRGIKRPSFEQINPRNLNAMDSLYMYQKLLLRGDNHTDLSNDLSSFIESQKRAKMQNDLSTRRPEGNPRGELTQNNGVYGNEFALRILNSCTGKFNPSSQVNGRQSHPALERSQRPSQGHEVNSLTAMVRWNRPPPTPPKDYSRPAVGSYPDTFIDKKRTTMQNSASQRSNRAMLQIRKDNPQVHQMSFPKPRGGPRKPKGVVSVEALTSLLEELCIYEKNKNKDRNVLVLYRGDNAIIPFEPIKKRKPRPKVDLDPESDRLWKLLMGPEGSTANETLDKDKEKWWEDERRVFRGRADSFIARMHLVQGKQQPPFPITMALLAVFSSSDKTTHNSHKFGFKLSPNNYGYWKAMLQPFLVTNNLFGYVDGTIPCPSATLPTVITSGKDTSTTSSETQPNPNHPIWVSNDAHVRMLLVSTISEASFQHVTSSTTSKDLWLSLERAYAPHTASREYTLRGQLLKIAMKDDETSSAYLTRAQEYADALANIGEPVKEKDLVMLVVSGLRDEYTSLKSNILTRQFPTAFVELHGLLSDHDYMIRKTAPEVPSVQAFTAASTHQNSTAASSINIQALQQLLGQLGLQVQPTQQPTQQPTSQAFYTHTPRQFRGNGNMRGRGSYNRRQGGVSRNQFSWASNQNTVFGTCNRCGIGHLPSLCPNRDPATIRNRGPPSANYSDHRSHAYDTRSQDFFIGVPDTGATDHSLPDHSSLDFSEPYRGHDGLHVGNGQVYTHYPPHGSKH